MLLRLASTSFCHFRRLAVAMEIVSNNNNNNNNDVDDDDDDDDDDNNDDNDDDDDDDDDDDNNSNDNKGAFNLHSWKYFNAQNSLTWNSETQHLLSNEWSQH